MYKIRRNSTFIIAVIIILVVLTLTSRAYAEGGIHEAIAYYEDNVFYEILAEELSRRDMDYPEINEDNYDEIIGRMQRYMEIFQISGVDRLVLEET